MRRNILLILGTCLIICVLFLGINLVKNRGQVAGESIDLEKQPIKGLILPHHDLAREIIIKSLEKLSSSNKYKLIVVLSPNHFRPQSYTFTTSLNDKNYPIAIEYLHKLKEFDQELLFDTELVENEHGVNIPVEYLSHYFPESEFLPILVSPYYSEKTLDEISQWMTENLPEDTLYVASVDFSHENMYAKALDNNKESLGVIKNFDYASLYNFVNDNNQHLDSPIGTAVLLKTMSALKATNWQTWYDSHGSQLTDDPVLQGTSYIIGVFR